MKANCINCGMEFDDPFPDAIMGMVNAGIEPEEIFAHNCHQMYCDECIEEYDRLVRFGKSISNAIMQHIECEFKLFGAKRKMRM